MSLGSNYNNNQNNNQRRDITIYSAYRMNNAESNIDATCITFRMWKTNLIISIYPRKNTGNDEIAFDMDNGISIYLSHAKARIFYNEIQNFLKDPITYNGVGVNSGQAVISISNGSDYGKDAPVLTIRKVDDNGNVVAAFAYEFKRNYHFAIRGYHGADFDKEFDSYNNLEIEQLCTMLEEYYKAATNAIAFTVMDQRNYSQTRMENKIDAIAQNLGVDLGSAAGGKKSYSNNSFFNRSSGNSGGGSSYGSGVSYSSGTIDDLE